MSWITDILKGKKVGADLLKIAGAVEAGLKTVEGVLPHVVPPGVDTLVQGVVSLLVGWGAHNAIDPAPTPPPAASTAPPTT